MIKGASGLQPEPTVFSDPEAAYKFACMKAWEENRDQWSRPKVMLPDGSKEVGYRRSSSYGAPLEDGRRLELWGKRQVARGVARSKAIALAVTRAEVGLESDDRDVVRDSRDRLDELAEEAMQVVGSGDKASIGTSLHDVFELIDLGKDPGHIPELWRPDVSAYRKLTQNFRTLSSERIVVQDDHRVGGTYDRVLELLAAMTVTDRKGNVLAVLPPGEIIIGDVKTSQDMAFAGAKFGVQTFVYATGTPYDPIKKLRTPWEHRPPSTEWAVILHAGSGTGQAAIHWVDLVAAAEAAERVREVYEWRNRRGKALIARGSVVEDFTVTCEYAQTVHDLNTAYQRALTAGEWTEMLKARFGKRKRELVAAAEPVEAVK